MPYQTVELRDRRLAGRLSAGDVPHLDTALPSGVDVLCGVGDGHRADDLSVVQRVHLSGVARDAAAIEGVRRKGHRIDLPVGGHVKGVGRLTARTTSASTGSSGGGCCCGSLQRGMSIKDGTGNETTRKAGGVQRPRRETAAVVTREEALRVGRGSRHAQVGGHHATAGTHRAQIRKGRPDGGRRLWCLAAATAATAAIVGAIGGGGGIGSTGFGIF